MEKICTRCKKTKLLTEFSAKKSATNGLHSHCRECIAAAMKKAYQANPAKKLEAINRCWERVSNAVNDIKRKMGCKFCTERESVCLDFHHLDPTKKDENVAYWVGTKNLAKAIEEISKCICVCSNCHRKLHAGLIKI